MECSGGVFRSEALDEDTGGGEWNRPQDTQDIGGGEWNRPHEAPVEIQAVVSGIGHMRLWMRTQAVVSGIGHTRLRT